MRRWLLRAGSGLVPLVCGGFLTGCANTQVHIPSGHLPSPSSIADTISTQSLTRQAAAPPAKDAVPPAAANAFDLPKLLAGDIPNAVAIPRFDKDAPADVRNQAVSKAYPPLTPLPESPAPAGPPRTLAELQALARETNPVIRQMRAEAEAAYGQVVQAGLHPNPTVGYQVDQWQPRLNNGQQGAFVNQIIKTAEKLPLAQQVAGYDYINALVAVRKAEVEVMTGVRSAYFAALIAKQSLDVNRQLAAMADEVYRLQLRQVAAGEAAGYEPLQAYAQAVQARNACVQAAMAWQVAWKQLAAAVGQPELTPSPLDGQLDLALRSRDRARLEEQVLDNHTEILTARNVVAQAQRNLLLQQRLPYPDLQTNSYYQRDTAVNVFQFGVQLGFQWPISDKNQGNIRTACAKIAVAEQQLLAARNSLSGRLAEALGRYEANVGVAANYRDRIIPPLTQAYRAIVRRYQVEPEKVGFNDIVVAQQNLAAALQGYLSILDAQWKAAIDLAAVAQSDELIPEPTENR